MGVKVAAGFIIFRRINHEIEYLLMQTSYGIHHWTPPKGHLDPGETEIEAAIRETFEESGLQKSDLHIFEDQIVNLNYDVNGKPKKVVYWLAELINKSAKVRLSEEHQDYQWLNLDNACKYASYEDMIKVLKNFDQIIKKF